MAHLLRRLRRPLHLLRRPPPPVPIPSKPLISSSLVRAYSGGGRVNLVLTDRGVPKFKIDEPEAPDTRKKWQTKKRLKEQRKREKQRRKEANRRDPRSIRPKGRKGKNKFPDAEERIKYKLEKAKIKETILVEKLKRYEVAEAEGPMVKPESLTGEERFYMKKMAQKSSNYVPIGRRGVFGGVILNMHLHWKMHETVKVICKPCKPGQVHEYARDIARLSGGIPIQVIGGDTIIFYRGKNYVRPEVMSPIDTLSKKKALEKSKYEQSLETVRRFIATSEKELGIYYRHIALYGDPNKRHSDLVYGDQEKINCNLDLGKTMSLDEGTSQSFSHTSTDLSEADISDDDDLNSTEIDSDDYLTEDEVIFEGEEPSESDVDSEQERKSSPTIDSGLVHRQD